MGRKFISVLGVNDYRECVYFDDNKKVKTRFIQEALLDMYFEDIQPDDKIYIFLTEKARECNWIGVREQKVRGLESIIKEKNLENFEEVEKLLKYQECWKDSKKQIKTIGLEEILKEKYSQAEIKAISICEGSSEEELWSIFEKILENIDDDEEIIFDITHGFRSIPMQALIVLNYAKVIKNIKILGIYYGAFEAQKDGNAPIFNLSVYNEIFDWISAANSFINYGNSNQISDLYEQLRRRKAKEKDYSIGSLSHFVQSVNCFTNCIQASRGKISYSEDCKNNRTRMGKSTHVAAIGIKDSLDKLIQENKKILKPLAPLFEKIENRVQGFYAESNLQIGLATVRWCINYGLIQQGYTAFEETIKTYLCNKYNMDEFTENTRDRIVKKAINDMTDNIKESKNTREIQEEKCKKFSSEENLLQYINIVKTIPEEIVKLSSKVSTFRNDMSHFGFTNKFSTYNVLKEELEKSFNEFEVMIDKYKDIEFI